MITIRLTWQLVGYTYDCNNINIAPSAHDCNTINMTASAYGYNEINMTASTYDYNTINIRESAYDYNGINTKLAFDYFILITLMTQKSLTVHHLAISLLLSPAFNPV